MQTVSAPTCLNVRLTITTTLATEFIDLTDRLRTVLAVAGLQSGIVNIQSLHTTAAIVLNEHEPLLLMDLSDTLERLAPERAVYAHDDAEQRTVNVTDEERPNGHAHCRALLLPSSACLNVVRGELQLGRWQRVFLVELDGPRDRTVSITMFGEAA